MTQPKEARPPPKHGGTILRQPDFLFSFKAYSRKELSEIAKRLREIGTAMPDARPESGIWNQILGWRASHRQRPRLRPISVRWLGLSRCAMHGILTGHYTGRCIEESRTAVSKLRVSLSNARTQR